MTNDDRGYAADDDKDKLIAELDVSSDEQIVWFGLAIAAVIAVLLFGLIPLATLQQFVRPVPTTQEKAKSSAIR